MLKVTRRTTNRVEAIGVQLTVSRESSDGIEVAVSTPGRLKVDRVGGEGAASPQRSKSGAFPARIKRR